MFTLYSNKKKESKRNQMRNYGYKEMLFKTARNKSGLQLDSCNDEKQERWSIITTVDTTNNILFYIKVSYERFQLWTECAHFICFIFEDIPIDRHNKPSDIQLFSTFSPLSIRICLCNFRSQKTSGSDPDVAIRFSNCTTPSSDQ